MVWSSSSSSSPVTSVLRMLTKSVCRLCDNRIICTSYSAGPNGLLRGRMVSVAHPPPPHARERRWHEKVCRSKRLKCLYDTQRISRSLWGYLRVTNYNPNPPLRLVNHGLIRLVVLCSAVACEHVPCKVSTIAVRQSFAACLVAVLGLIQRQASCVNDALHSRRPCSSARKPAPKADPAARPPKPCRYRVYAPPRAYMIWSC